MLPWMLVLVALLVPPRVHDNVNEDKKSQGHQQNHAGPVFPNLLEAIHQLGQIHAAHAALEYTESW
jgi:hypothetical protein